MPQYTFCYIVHLSAERLFTIVHFNLIRDISSHLEKIGLMCPGLPYFCIRTRSIPRLSQSRPALTPTLELSSIAKGLELATLGFTTTGTQAAATRVNRLATASA